MNKENAAQFLPLVQALAEGKQLQFKRDDDKWYDVTEVCLGSDPSRYRIKPEPRRIWVNKYESLPLYAYESKAQAQREASSGVTSIAVEYVEVIK